MKWCIIGAGGIADRRTIPALLKDGENQLVAVMDRNEKTAVQIGNKYGVPYFFSEEEMLKSVDCDVVYIGTPVSCHYDQTMIALKYNKPVFVEKPLAMNAKVAQEILDAFKAKNVQLTVGYMMKYHNLHVKAKEIIKNGGIGQPVDIRAQFSCWYPDIPGAWRQKKALGGGGAIMDLGVHCIELIDFLTEEEIIDAKGFYSTQTFNYEVEDSGIIIFKTSNGILGHIDVNFNIPDKASESKLEIYGTKGYIICRGTLAQEEKGTMSYLYAPQGEYSAMQNRTTDKPEEYSGEDGDLYLKQIRVFNDCVKSGKPDYGFAERAIAVQKVVDKIYSE